MRYIIFLALKLSDIDHHGEKALITALAVLNFFDGKAVTSQFPVRSEAREV